MSNGRKRKDSHKTPITHCAEGRCMKDIRKGFEWASCIDFRRLVNSGKNPTNCPYYNHRIDRKKFDKQK